MSHSRSAPAVIASFDVEEHHRIEAAAGIDITPSLRIEYAQRMDRVTRRLLDQLANARVLATFYIVGTIARTHPTLVRDIARAGHEIGSHSWDHRRVHHFTPSTFRDDVLMSKDALEQASGTAVVGFRAPTFSVVRATGWAIDVLADLGFEYDSSIFPVRHDRYGIPAAPRGPFLAVGPTRELIELPPITYRFAGMNLPVAGGGYFRLFPLAMMRAGLKQAANWRPVAAGMLYFHPWEFDSEQPRLPLRRVSKWRTYVGIRRTTARLQSILRSYSFCRAIDVVRDIRRLGTKLERYQVADSGQESVKSDLPVPHAIS